MPKTKEVSHPARNSLLTKAKVGGAVLLSSAGLGLATAQKAHAAPDHKTGRLEMPQNLTDPSELPGVHKHLSMETLNSMVNSTVEIGKRLKGSADWQPLCTAVKVEIADPKTKKPEDYIMTAAHCFGDVTGVSDGVFNLDNTAAALNYIGQSPYEYSILDPHLPLNQRLKTPIAEVDGISVSIEEKDAALLSVQPIPKPTNAFLLRKYSDVPAIPLKVAETPPLAGTPVALYGEPQANGFEPIAGTGIYLGRTVLEDTINIPDATGVLFKYQTFRTVDLVGINPANPEDDNCNFATSGSMARLADGRMLGNLSQRFAQGYGPDLYMQPADSRDWYNYWIPQWSAELGIDLSKFTVICAYTVMDHTTPHNLASGLDIPVTPVKPLRSIKQLANAG